MITILVIEDDVDIRINILEILSMNNFTVFEAQNGLVGVELAKKHLPELIICDINMPELDGFDVLRHLRNDPPTATIPFIFLTSQTDKTLMCEGMNLGADDYLTKPFTLEELLTAIKARLEKHDLVAKENEQKLDDLRGNILHALPHELRTPLTGIIGSAELIVEYGDKIIDMGANILESAERLYHLTENYFFYAQLEYPFRSRKNETLRSKLRSILFMFNELPDAASREVLDPMWNIICYTLGVSMLSVRPIFR